VKQHGSGNKMHWVGPFLAILVLLGVVLLVSGRWRGRGPFPTRRDGPHAADSDPCQVLPPSAPTQSEVPAGEDQCASSTRKKSADLTRIEGIGPGHAGKLRTQGLRSTGDLLLAGASPEGRERLAMATDVSGTMILHWVNQADLLRIKGVGSEYAGLLAAAGVDNVPELAKQDVDTLGRLIEEVNREKTLVRRNPADAQVADWIETAKGLPRLVVY
jgi:predicted flap endonuclease-1-like 5' DNA nuclease